MLLNISELDCCGIVHEKVKIKGTVWCVVVFLNSLGNK